MNGRVTEYGKERLAAHADLPAASTIRVTRHDGDRIGIELCDSTGSALLEFPPVVLGENTTLTLEGFAIPLPVTLT